MNIRTFVLLDPPATITLPEAFQGILAMSGSQGDSNEELRRCWQAVYAYIVSRAENQLRGDDSVASFLKDIVQVTGVRLFHMIERLQRTAGKIKAPKALIAKILRHVIADFRKQMVPPVNYKARKAAATKVPRVVEITEVQEALHVDPTRDIEDELTGLCNTLAAREQISCRDAQLFCALLKAGALEKGTQTGKARVAEQFGVSPATVTNVTKRVCRLIVKEMT
jgi:DNA-directed RNA polymerase specialized sigma24 family protein